MCDMPHSSRSRNLAGQMSQQFAKDGAFSSALSFSESLGRNAIANIITKQFPSVVLQSFSNENLPS